MDCSQLQTTKYILTLVERKDLPDASSVLSTSKEFGKILSSGIFTLILSIYIGDQPLGLEEIDHLLIASSNLMMFICILFSVSATVFLFYSLYKYDTDENTEILELFKKITPKWIKKKD